MKLFLLAVVIAFASCSKSSNETLTVTPPPAEKKPEINSVTFGVASAGSNESVRFTVKLTADSSQVNKVVLYTKLGSMRWEVLKPTTGTYTMYDHMVADYPLFHQEVYYFFTFFMKSGAKISTEPFHVY